MRVLYLDCFSGISGDMTVGALCDLGVQPSTLEWELSKIELGDYHMHFDRKQRQGVEGVKFTIHEGATHTHDQDEPEESCCHGHHHAHHHHHDHGHAHSHEHHHGHGEGKCCHHHEHGHEHGEHGHHHHHHHGHEDEHAHGRNFAEIKALIEASDLSPFVKEHSISIFRRIAEAEGRIHGKPPHEVGFHEVGALDSIADIICACVGIEALGIDAIHVSPLAEGRGWVKCAHGQIPVPAMATLEILKGIPLRQIDEPYEFITPTGAAIVAEFAKSFGLMPEMKIEKIGYGIGTRMLPNRPNVLRAVLGTVEQKGGGYLTDTVTRIETNIDDLSPEITASTLGKLLDAGALDAFLTPVQMKKNRTGLKLTVLCEEAAVAKMADILFRETTAFGIRMDQLTRWKLERRFVEVSTPYGPVTVKVGSRGDEELQAAPEFESCRAVSERTGQPLRVIYEAALQAYRAR